MFESIETKDYRFVTYEETKEYPYHRVYHMTFQHKRKKRYIYVIFKEGERNRLIVKRAKDDKRTKENAEEIIKKVQEYCMNEKPFRIKYLLKDEKWEKVLHQYENETILFLVKYHPIWVFLISFVMNMMFSEKISGDPHPVLSFFGAGMFLTFHFEEVGRYVYKIVELKYLGIGFFDMDEIKIELIKIICFPLLFYGLSYGMWSVLKSFFL